MEQWLDILPPPSPRAAAVVSFPGFVAVAADVDPRWVRSWVVDGDRSGPLSPLFLGALEELLRLTVHNVDMVVLARSATGDPPIGLIAEDGSDHPRVARARRYRSDVRVWRCDGGMLILGRGLAGRWEATVEVAEGRRNGGLGRALAAAACHLVPDGRPVWAQIAPGDAAGIRAFLAAGYQPVGAEAQLRAPV